MSNRVVSGISWSAIQQFSTQGIQFIVSVILARILTPSEFGLVAISLVILNILQTINETGFGAALMQKLDRDDVDFNSVFFLNLALGVGLYLILFLAAPFLKYVFHEDQVTSVIRLIGLNLIISSFVVVQRTKLMIAVNFKTWTVATVVGAVISGICSIIYALNNGGVYAIVLQSLMNNLITTAMIWACVKWRPSFKVSLERLKSLYNFAYKLIVARLINTVFNEVYSATISIFFAPKDLAFYNRANSFQSIGTSSITSVFQRVSIPIMCERQNSIELLASTLNRFVGTTALIVYPLLTLLIILARPLILCLLTDKWSESIWILQFISISGFFYVISTFNLNLFNATGKTSLALKCESLKKGVAIAIIVLAVMSKSFTYLVFAQVAIAIIDFIITTYYTKQLVNLSIIEQLSAVFPVLIACCIMGAIVFLSTIIIENILLKLIVGALIGVGAYCIIIIIANINNSRRILSKLVRH